MRFTSWLIRARSPALRGFACLIPIRILFPLVVFRRVREIPKRGAIGFPGNQGITAGWADTYRFTLAGQYFVLDGGDGQPVVPPGDYIIRITVNPPFVAKKNEACPNRDPQGFCHQLPETTTATTSARRRFRSPIIPDVKVLDQ